MVDKIDTCASETQISTAEFDRIRFLDGDLRRLRAERDAMIDDARWWGTIRNCGMPTLPLVLKVGSRQRNRH